MKILLYHLGCWLKIKFCQHDKKDLTYMCYIDRYAEYICYECEKKNYEDI
jgi:hypothetical protein